VLGAVKTEFEKFGTVLAQVKKKLNEASDQIEQTEVRTRAISRKLRDVEALPAPEDYGNGASENGNASAAQNPLGI
jgi:DNA recombination protein RmuC